LNFDLKIIPIKQVQGDKLEMSIGLYGYGRSNGALKAIREGETRDSNYYSEETKYFYLNELKNMKENGVIRVIKRI
jgi:hypothetical protein